MGILISQDYAKVGVERTPGKLEIQTTRAKLEMERFQPDLNMHTEQPCIEIDQYDAFASAGRKGNGDLAKDAAAAGYQQLLAYIAKVAGQGDRFAAIHTKENVVAALGAESAVHQLDYNVGLMPSEPPHFNAEPWRVTFDPDPMIGEDMNNCIRTRYIPGEVNVSFVPDAVRGYMLQMSAAKIDYSGSLEYNWTTLNTRV